MASLPPWLAAAAFGLRPSQRLRSITLLIIGCAILESGAAIVVHRPVYRDDEWATLRTFAAENPSANLIMDGTWRSDVARFAVPKLFDRALVAPADSSSFYLRRHGEALKLSNEWHENSRLEFGSFALVQVDRSPSSSTLIDWFNPSIEQKSLPALQIYADDQPCIRRRDHWQCVGATVRLGFAEVGYKIARCLIVDGDEGINLDLEVSTTSTVEPTDVVALQGEIGKSDFNAALRNESPLAITVLSQDEVVAHALFDDHHGMNRWRLALPPGLRKRLRVRVLLPALRSWQANGQAAPYPGVICLTIASEVAAP